MTRDEFTKLMNETFAEIKELHESKGREYAGDEDSLDNFKRHAKNLGLKPEHIWAVYASKHFDAIISYVRNGGVLSNESIEGRIDDLILYALLLKGIVKEKGQAVPPDINQIVAQSVTSLMQNVQE